MKITTLILLTCVSFVSFTQDNQKVRLKQGGWIGALQLNEKDVLPFNFIVKKQKGTTTFTVENGEEMIKLDSAIVKNDSVHVRFPYFNSELVFAATSKKEVNGYWVNYNKGPHYKIPFTSKRAKKAPRFMEANKTKSASASVNGRWRVTFEPNTNSAYPAIGIFEQAPGSTKVSGTFLTETGDYRYLEGNLVDDSLYLSCFDGSHAFLFKGNLKGDSLYGTFFSGNHWSSSWIGVRDENAELKSPDELTYLVDQQPISFELKDLEGNDFSFPNADYAGKVVIIQIMGSWCPNCLDETQYYKELYANYHSKGLEIISIGYEMGNSFEDYAANIERLRNKLSLPFHFLVGGKASKGMASEHFSALNKIISFPTSIYIGRDGTVKRIHTGFNGPGTGSYYTDYVQNTNSLIESLLAE